VFHWAVAVVRRLLRRPRRVSVNLATLGTRTSPDAVTALGLRAQQDSYAALARALAYLFVVGSLFALAAMVITPANDTRPAVVALIGAGMAAAAVLWLRAHRMNRWTCRLLTLVGSAATATAVYLTESSDTSGSGGIDAQKLHWFLTVGTFLLGGVLIHRLVLRLREYVQILDDIARTDQLTSVPNRRAWDEALPAELDRCRREGRPVCVAMIDIDHFKAFNDSRGHQEGDMLLRRATTAWQGQLRDDDLLSRYGGEEFAVILRNCTLPDAALALERLREATPDGQTCSVGLAAWDGRETPLQLLARADDALYTSKKHGRDRLTVAEWNQVAPPPPSGWTVAVREVIEANAVMTAYQPIVDLSGDTALGYEALARTSGRSTGVPIGEVFANAKRMGLTREMDWLCRRAALRSASRIPSGSLLFLNVSLAQLLDPLHDVDQMLLLLDYHKMSPRRVVLEVSERDHIADPDRFRHVLTEYRRHGFRFAIDDIGDGRSALETLVAATPEFVKVAPRLTQAGEGTIEHAALCAVLAFSQHSGALVIAEGVENVEDAQRIRRIGITHAQGYLLSRPSFETVSAVPTMAAG